MSLFSVITRKTSPATRKDLLQVQNAAGSEAANAVADLENLGFSVTQRGQGHWVVTGLSSLPELHFYSQGELGRFASDRARYYVEPLHRENLP